MPGSAATSSPCWRRTSRRATRDSCWRSGCAPRPKGPPPSLILRAHRGAGTLSVYDDAGDGLAYEGGAFSRTEITQIPIQGGHRVTIGAARGAFTGVPATRTYDLRIAAIRRPRTVTVGGRRTSSWSYDARTRTVRVRPGRLSTRRSTRVVLRWAPARRAGVSPDADRRRRGRRPSLTG